MKRMGRGWRKNRTPFKATFTGKHALSRAGMFGDFSDLTEFCPDVMDQGFVGACTAHAVSDAAVTSFAKSGLPLGFVPSQRDLYALSRSIERARLGLPPRTTPLSDGGAYPVDVMAAIERWGLRSMGPRIDGRFSDVGEENVNGEVHLGDLEADAAHRIESHAILGGPHIAEDVCSALKMYACPTGFFVDTAFEEWIVERDGFIGAPKNPYDPFGGGHYVDIVAFVRAGLLAQDPATYIPRRLHAKPSQIGAIATSAAALPPEEPVLFVKNSWGDWGIDGYFVATVEWLRAPQTGDVNAILPVFKETP